MKPSGFLIAAFFDSQYYKQVESVAIDLPLSPQPDSFCVEDFNLMKTRFCSV
jgi:hypothetical protein